MTFIPRQEALRQLRNNVANGRPIIGAGAGTGISAKFAERTQMVVEQFSHYEPQDSLFVDGELTLGENIADLGGVAMAFEAYMNSLKGKEKKIIDGYTPEQRFFIGYAQVWKANYIEEAM